MKEKNVQIEHESVWSNISFFFWSVILSDYLDGI